MLERIISSFLPSDPVDMVLNYIDGNDILIQVGDKLTVKFVISKKEEQRLEDGRTVKRYDFSGEIARRS